MPKACALDLGTMFFQTAFYDDDDNVVTNIIRNAFIELKKTDDIDEMLKQNKFQYVEDENNVYIIGEDASRFATILPGKVELRRPLQNGVLNPDEEMKNIVINELISSSIGEAPDSSSVVATCVSSPPADDSPTNVFHQRRLEGMLKSKGWNPVVIEEALAVILAENPTTESSEGEKLPFTGIGVSFGAGRANVVLSYKGVTAVGMSAGRSGDWIDTEVSRNINIPVTQVTSYKEKTLDLNNIDDNSDIAFALGVFYDEMLRYTFTKFAQKVSQKGDSSKYDFPLDIVVAGGTSTPNGFIERVESTVRELDLPFTVREVRMAKDPRNAVVKGLLVRASSAVKSLSEKRFKAALGE